MSGTSISGCDRVSIAARYFDGKTSTAHVVEVSFFGDGRLHVAGGGVERSAHVSELKISERIGNATRRIYFPDGALCEAADNDFIDQWLTHLGAHSAGHRIFRLERRWRYALGALVLTIAGSWAFIRYGIPVTADYAARVLPRSIDAAIGNGGLEAMDALFMAPTALSMAQQAQVRAVFDRMQREMNTALPLQLELRSSEAVGPNAFALPSGIIVMTDQLVEIAERPEEIESVLAHEVGHIVHRHSLRMVLQSSASALLMFTLLGDVSSASTLAASVPTVLVQAKHSRDFEREADAYAFGWLRKRGIATHHFGDILKRIEAEHGDEEDSNGRGVMSYFSSHPRTEERAKAEE